MCKLANVHMVLDVEFAHLPICKFAHLIIC